MQYAWVWYCSVALLWCANARNSDLEVGLRQVETDLESIVGDMSLVTSPRHASRLEEVSIKCCRCRKRSSSSELLSQCVVQAASGCFFGTYSCSTMCHQYHMVVMEKARVDADTCVDAFMVAGRSIPLIECSRPKNLEMLDYRGNVIAHTIKESEIALRLMKTDRASRIYKDFIEHITCRLSILLNAHPYPEKFRPFMNDAPKEWDVKKAGKGSCVVSFPDDNREFWTSLSCLPYKGVLDTYFFPLQRTRRCNTFRARYAS